MLIEDYDPENDDDAANRTLQSLELSCTWSTSIAPLTQQPLYIAELCLTGWELSAEAAALLVAALHQGMLPNLTLFGVAADDLDGSWQVLSPGLAASQVERLHLEGGHNYLQAVPPLVACLTGRAHGLQELRLPWTNYSCLNTFQTLGSFLAQDGHLRVLDISRKVNILPFMGPEWAKS